MNLIVNLAIIFVGLLFILWILMSAIKESKKMKGGSK